MQPIVFQKTGEPEDVLHLMEFPDREPQAGEIRVKVAARPIHPSDLMFIQGRYRWKPSFPQVAGTEGAGTVEAAGPGGEIKPGTRVSEWTGGRGVKACLDAVGGETGAEAIRNLAPGGQLIVYGILDAGESHYLNSTILYKNLTVSAFGIDGWSASLDANARKEVQREITRAAQDDLPLGVEESYPLQRFGDALAI